MKNKHAFTPQIFIDMLITLLVNFECEVTDSAKPCFPKAYI